MVNQHLKRILLTWRELRIKPINRDSLDATHVGSGIRQRDAPLFPATAPQKERASRQEDRILAGDVLTCTEKPMQPTNTVQNKRVQQSFQTRNKLMKDPSYLKTGTI